MKPITRIEAINTIVEAAQRDNVSVVIYKRLLRSISALGLTAQEGEHLLNELEYHIDGKLRTWIAERLGKSSSR